MTLKLIIYVGLGILIPFLSISMAERARRNPERYKETFMANNGYTRSFVALRYFGEPEVAQREFVTNVKVRNAWIIERYAWAIFTFALSIVLLYTEVFQ